MTLIDTYWIFITINQHAYLHMAEYSRNNASWKAENQREVWRWLLPHTPDCSGAKGRCVVFTPLRCSVWRSGMDNLAHMAH